MTLQRSISKKEKHSMEVLMTDIDVMEKVKEGKCKSKIVLVEEMGCCN